MEYERLSYREIGLRLHITTDAARMKAKREAKAGRWRLIPGNHPNDPVTCEVPIGTLPSLKDGHDLQPAGKSEGAWQQFAKEQAARVAELTTQLVSEKEAHGRTLSELTAAEMRELGTAAELDRALQELAELKTRLHRRRWIKGG